MKVAVSIPDDVYQTADGLARELDITRSRLYALAIAEFVRRHQAAEPSEVLNSLYVYEDSPVKSLLSRTQRLAIEREEWSG